MIIGRDELASGGWRVGVIDVGTNSIRLIVGEVAPDLSYRVIDDEKIRTRLGEGVDEHGALSLEAMSRSAECIARLHHIAGGYDLRGLRAVATSAVRDATNRQDMLTLVRERAGIDLEVLSGEDEARYAYASVSAAFDMRTISSAVLDIGGGSTELVINVHGVTDVMESLPLGAIRLTEQFGTCEDAEGKQLRDMRAFLREYVNDRISKPPVDLHVIVGSGGAVRSMAGISMHRAATPGSSEMLPRIVRGYEMSRSEVRSILHRLDGMSIRERASIPGLSPDRADIIVAGVAIMERFMKRLGADRLRAHDRGIRDGVIRAMIQELAPHVEHCPRPPARCNRPASSPAPVASRRSTPSTWPSSRCRCSIRSSISSTPRTRRGVPRRRARCCTSRPCSATWAISSATPSTTSTAITSSCTVSSRASRIGSWRSSPTWRDTTAARCRR